MGPWRCRLHFRYRIEPTPCRRATGPALSASRESGDCASTRVVGRAFHPARGEQKAFDTGPGALGTNQRSSRLGLLARHLDDRSTLLAFEVIDRHRPSCSTCPGSPKRRESRADPLHLRLWVLARWRRSNPGGRSRSPTIARVTRTRRPHIAERSAMGDRDSRERRRRAHRRGGEERSPGEPQRWLPPIACGSPSCGTMLRDGAELLLHRRLPHLPHVTDQIGSGREGQLSGHPASRCGFLAARSPHLLIGLDLPD
jgi:hypothetical protein